MGFGMQEVASAVNHWCPNTWNVNNGPFLFSHFSLEQSHHVKLFIPFDFAALFLLVFPLSSGTCI